MKCKNCQSDNIISYPNLTKDGLVYDCSYCGTKEEIKNLWWNKYINIPFEEKGRTEKGADCWGLIRIIKQREEGIILPSYDDLYETTNEHSHVGKVVSSVRAAAWIDIEQPRAFDVIILKTYGVPMHVGIVTKPNYMLHCSYGIGTVHESYKTMKWKNKVCGFSRYEQ